MGFLEKIKALFGIELSEKEKYYKHKQELEDTALTDTVFWDRLDNIDKKEFNKRKKFLKYWEQVSNLITVQFGQDKTKNMQQLLMAMQLGNKTCLSDSLKLRNLRFAEGQIQMLYGTIQQATNCYMQILFLDINDDIAMAINPVIAPKIYKWAFQEDLPLDKFEKIFIYNAEKIIKHTKLKINVTPEDAWEIIMAYKNKNP